MQQDFDCSQCSDAFDSDSHATDREPLQKKGHTLVAWISIVGLTFIFVMFQLLAHDAGAEKATAEKLELLVFEMQARYLIGAGQSFPETRPELFESAQVLPHNTVAQRLRFVTIAGELKGPNEALAALEGLQGGGQEQSILERLYGDYAEGRWHAPSIALEERTQLVAGLGWFGELALNPLPRRLPFGEAAVPAGAAPAVVLGNQAPDFARRAQIVDHAVATFHAVVGAVGAFIFVGLAGFIGLIVFVSLLARHKLESGITPGAAHGGLYAETFAIWLALLLGLQMALIVSPINLGMLGNGAFLMLGSMAALAWPVLRGIPWAQVRHDIGWSGGRGAKLEPFVGVACYAMSMPLLAIGLIVTFVLLSLQQVLAAGLGQQGVPIHPIVEFLANGDAATRIQAVLLASVVAPIVEETMFRGVLYRHLRELTGSWAWLWSVIVSGTVVSFLFAAIHPQGLLAVPALMALAYGFTIAREWRGTLIPSMVAHALNNGLVVGLLILLLGD